MIKILKQLSSLFSLNTQTNNTVSNINKQKMPKLNPKKRVIKQVDEWEYSDKAAEHFFEVLCDTTLHIASNRAYVTWAAEFEISEALEKIDNGQFPLEIGDIFKSMITAFQDALDSGEYDDFRHKSNYFTIAYSFSQFDEIGQHQDHRLSIGCPIGVSGGSRFKTSMTKSRYETYNIGEHNGVWIGKETEYDNLTIGSCAPAAFDDIALSFFRYLEKAYNPQSDIDNSQKFLVGGAYGPSSTLG